jgi:hypothetical protein
MLAAAAVAVPAMICYSISPNQYINDHAAEIKGLYDGFYIQCGSWDGGVTSFIGADGTPPSNAGWLPLARQNIEALRAQGITENLLAVSFGSDEPWPSPETLLSEEFTEKMRRHFRAIGHTARELGFRGVSIDVEYPYPRYILQHPIYTYDGYTPGDLLAAAYRQGRASMAAILDEFPEAVIFVLPGFVHAKTIEREYLVGLLDEMAQRNAPGGFHVATEYSYCLHDPVTQAAIPRHDDPAMAGFLSPATLRYWKDKCTMAPGVWPSHMVETGGEGYPERPWGEELRDLDEQMKILRAITKRYIWSFSGQPIWFVPSDGIKQRYGIGANYPGAATEFIPGWHRILRDKTPYERSRYADARMLRLFEKVRAYDEGTLGDDELCDAFGTPGTWWALGPLGNPHTKPARTAEEAFHYPISPRRMFYGRDGAVRWFLWPNRDPRGHVEVREVIEYLATDDASFHFACWIESERAQEAVLHTGWDDGIVVWIGDEVAFTRPDYPPVGHGLLFRDKYQFEEHVPVRIPAGRTRLAVTSINSHGVWAFTLRITDRDGYPLEGVRFLAGQER